MKDGRRVGIMGGTFNPIHIGHLKLAQCAMEQLGLDKVVFIPSGNSYMKSNVLDTKMRVEMTALAILDIPCFELSLVETQRAGNSYTYETLETLTEENPGTHYFFLIGADSLFQIETWRYPERIFGLATLVCTVREGYDLNALREKGSDLALRGADIIYLNMPKIDISSTDIRDRVKNNMPISEYVPPRVADYIKKERLYNEED